MTYSHAATGLIFERQRGASPVRITGNTYPHSSELRAGGFAWDAEAKQWVGEAANLCTLRVPEAFRIFSGLEIQTKNKIGGKIAIVGL
jgi:hypothetical protein